MLRSLYDSLRNFFGQILSIIGVASLTYVIAAFADAPRTPEDHPVSPLSVGNSSTSALTHSADLREIMTAGPPDSMEASLQDAVYQYLWNVYRRSSMKRDSHGDFTWKDTAAAERLGLSVQDYVIGGMDPDFRELLFQAGREMDAAGISWTVLSGFRDDYRQELAVGLKAHVNNSFHGGSVATGGYGHGCAVDVASPDGVTNSAVWNWLDQHGGQFGVHRALHEIDPAHVQPLGAWHSLAATLRNMRLVNSEPDPVGAPGKAGQKLIPPLAESSPPAGLTAEQYNCVRQRPLIEAAASELAIHPKRLLLAPPTLAYERPALLHEKNEWAVQLIGDESEAKALARYSQLRRRYSAILGPYEPVVLRTAVGRSPAAWHRVQVAMDTRKAAESLCKRLKAAGQNCVIQRN